MDTRFEPFQDSLFSQTGIAVSRDQQTKAEIEVLDASLSAYLQLLTDHFLSAAAFQTLEYLIRKYRYICTARRHVAKLRHDLLARIQVRCLTCSRLIILDAGSMSTMLIRPLLVACHTMPQIILYVWCKFCTSRTPAGNSSAQCRCQALLCPAHCWCSAASMTK